MSASVVRPKPDRLDSTRLSRQIGAAAALASAFFGFLYVLGLCVNLATSGSIYPAGSDVKSVSAVIALVWNVALVVLFVTLQREAHPARAVLAETALVFAVLVCAVSASSWFLALTALPRLARSADPALAGLFDPYNESSLAYALEHLGWGLFFGLAAVLAGFSLSAKDVSPWLRWSLVLTGVLSLAHALGVAAGHAGLIALGSVSWGIVLPFACLLLARLFRRRLAFLSP